MPTVQASPTPRRRMPRVLPWLLGCLALALIYGGLAYSMLRAPDAVAVDPEPPAAEVPVTEQEPELDLRPSAAPLRLPTALPHLQRVVAPPMPEPIGLALPTAQPVQGQAYAEMLRILDVVTRQMTQLVLDLEAEGQGPEQIAQRMAQFQEHAEAARTAAEPWLAQLTGEEKAELMARAQTDLAPLVARMTAAVARLEPESAPLLEPLTEELGDTDMPLASQDALVEERLDVDAPVLAPHID